MNLILILASVACGAVGQIFLKEGAMRINSSQLVGTLKFFNLPIIFGFLLYGLSSVMWLFVLRKVQLSYAYPMISLGYIIVFVASYFVFHESLSFFRLVGLGFIIIGILFVARS